LLHGAIIYKKIPLLYYFRDMEIKNKSLNYDPSHFSEFDIYLFKGGDHYRLYEKLGAHVKKLNGISGTYFAVWAPNAASVSVAGDFNGWSRDLHHMGQRWDGSGIWELFIPGIGQGELYKYHIISRTGSYRADKCDPFGYFCETPPKTASIVYDLEKYNWNDNSWMSSRKEKNSLSAPMVIYELHAGSWKHDASGRGFLNYRQMAPLLCEHIKKLGFTHIEFMPLMEHPFYGSWGYQVTGYFAPTSRYGAPQDLMYLIDFLHNEDIGVILDWVPSHFPDDLHGLYRFDGTFLFEHEDPRKGFHPDWKSMIFNYGRAEVKEFLISSAIFWLDKYHADALRIDGVASMLYLDYSRKQGEWVPNKYGGRENLEATEFLKKLNTAVYSQYPDVQTIAEESTAWPAVTKPVNCGGLGFGMKWNMGWMYDTLLYFSKDPVYRKYHQNELTFSFWYAFQENFVLPLSHDEVVYGKRSLLEKMPGDDWQKFANLRLLLAYMYSFPGKKLLFMGSEFAQRAEWNHDMQLEWHEQDYQYHQNIENLVCDLNRIYINERALSGTDFAPESFEWIDYHDWQQSLMFFLRKLPEEKILVACNFTPTPHYNYKIGVPDGGPWKEILNTDSSAYGGSGHGNFGEVIAQKPGRHGRQFCINITLPPLGIIFFKKALGQENVEQPTEKTVPGKDGAAK